MRAVRASRLLLLIGFLLFFAYATVYVPRLANPLWSDGQFSGWVAPFSQAMNQGTRLYNDITMPIPAGSFVLLSAIQRMTGRYLLVDELWVCAISHILMAAAAYFIVRPFVSRWTSSLVALSTIPLLIEQPKEIAYDHTALVFGWAMVAFFGAALVNESEKKRNWLMAAAGACAMLDLAFKTSSGMGAVAGIIGALFAITLATRIRFGAAKLGELWGLWRFLGLGMLIGTTLHVFLILAVGGNFSEYLRMVFVEGPRLKSGPSRLILDLVSYTVFQAPVRLSFLIAAVLAVAVVRAMKAPCPLRLEASPADDTEFESSRRGIYTAVAVGLGTASLFGGAIWLLKSEKPAAPELLKTLAAYGFGMAHIALFVLAVYLVGSISSAKALPDRRMAFIGVVIAASGISLFQNLSWPILLPILHNNPFIPLALACILELFSQAKLSWFRYVLVALFLFGLFGDKFHRYSIATTEVTDPGFWKGLRINKNGEAVLAMAKRARELAGEDGQVLMLPEDPMVEALIGKARPPLKGAVVFVDQYPLRALQRDLKVVEKRLPEVVIIHPRETVAWASFYSTWSNNSPAAQFQTQFAEKFLKTEYHLDSSYNTFFIFRGIPTHMDLYLRNSPE